MSAQDKIERTLKRIHVLFAKGESPAGEPGKVIVDRTEVFSILDELNRAIYEMMDQYEMTSQSRELAQRRTEKKSEELIAKVERKTEDVYAASLLYTDDALNKVYRLMTEALTASENIWRSLRQNVEEEQRKVKEDQLELHGQLQDFKDSNKYLNIIESYNREREKQEREAQADKGPVKKIQNEARHYPMREQPEIRINQAYFERRGLLKAGGSKTTPDSGRITFGSKTPDSGRIPSGGPTAPDSGRIPSGGPTAPDSGRITLNSLKAAAGKTATEDAQSRHDERKGAATQSFADERKRAATQSSADERKATATRSSADERKPAAESSASEGAANGAGTAAEAQISHDEMKDRAVAKAAFDKNGGKEASVHLTEAEGDGLSLSRFPEERDGTPQFSEAEDGLSLSQFPEEDPETFFTAPEVMVDLDAEYFRWQEEQKGKSGAASAKKGPKREWRFPFGRK